MRLLEQVVDAGCKVSIDSDAHAPGQLEWQPYGCARAAEADVPAERIVNAWARDRPARVDRVARGGLIGRGRRGVCSDARRSRGPAADHRQGDPVRERPSLRCDAFGPVLAFYVLWKLWGPRPGIIAATVVALVAYRYERKQDRPALVVRISLLFVLIEAVVGLWTGSAEIYLAIPVVVNAGYGLVFIGSTVSGGRSPACSRKRCCRCPTR